jgi:Domain of unknown function (DUF4372)/Transposase DDE domain
MYTGHHIFTQLMDHVPWHIFRQCVARYDGEHKIKHFSCRDQFRCYAFAQLTWRESLRDIEACLNIQSSKLYHLGFRCPRIARNTMANANAVRDWRIYADFAQHLIGLARKLYANDTPPDLEGLDTVYALDSSTIDLCLSVFPWAPFRSTKAAIKLHTLLDLRGSIPSFIFISDGKMHDVNILDKLILEPGAFYVMDRGYVDFERLARIDDAGCFFVTRAKSNMRATRRYSRPVDRTTGLICDQTIILIGFYSRQGFDRPLRRIKFNDPDTGKSLVFLTNNCFAGHDHCQTLQISLACRTVSQMDQTTFADQGILRHLRKCRQSANLVGGLCLCAHRHRQKTARPHQHPLRNSRDFEPQPFRENQPSKPLSGHSLANIRARAL